MEPIVGRKSPTGVADKTALARSIARFLLERAERQTGSRMAAYEMVAQTVGATAQWLRKFINGSEAKEPTWAIGWNLIEYYNRICTRVEQEIETERYHIQTLKKEIDAVTSPVTRMVEIARRAQAPGTSEEEIK